MEITGIRRTNRKRMIACLILEKTLITILNLQPKCDKRVQIFIYSGGIGLKKVLPKKM